TYVCGYDGGTWVWRLRRRSVGMAGTTAQRRRQGFTDPGAVSTGERFGHSVARAPAQAFHWHYCVPAATVPRNVPTERTHDDDLSSQDRCPERGRPRHRSPGRVLPRGVCRRRG